MDEQLIPRDLEELEQLAQETDEPFELIDVILRAFTGMDDESDSLVVIDYAKVEGLHDEVQALTTIKRLSKVDNILARLEEAFQVITASHNLTAVYDRLRKICMNDLASTMEFDYLDERINNGSHAPEISLQAS